MMLSSDCDATGATRKIGTQRAFSGSPVKNALPSGKRTSSNSTMTHNGVLSFVLEAFGSKP